MNIKILLFATLKDLAGERELNLTLPLEVATVEDVRRALTERFPLMESNLGAALASVNQEFAQNGDTVKDDDELAFFPPVSGGGDESHPETHPEVYLLPDAPVNHDDLIASITTSATGAVCLFSGMVRGETQREGHLPQTTQLEYEAYEPMALAKMRQVAAEIRERWPLVLGVAIVQRVGLLRVGENTVLIACSSAHRDDGCFEAARYGIDRLKEIVPVWKKEIGADGATWIEGSYTPTSEDKAKS